MTVSLRRERVVRYFLHCDVCDEAWNVDVTRRAHAEAEATDHRMTHNPHPTPTGEARAEGRGS